MRLKIAGEPTPASSGNRRIGAKKSFGLSKETFVTALPCGSDLIAGGETLEQLARTLVLWGSRRSSGSKHDPLGYFNHSGIVVALRPFRPGAHLRRCYTLFRRGARDGGLRRICHPAVRART